MQNCYAVAGWARQRILASSQPIGSPFTAGNTNIIADFHDNVGKVLIYLSFSTRHSIAPSPSQKVAAKATLCPSDSRSTFLHVTAAYENRPCVAVISPLLSTWPARIDVILANSDTTCPQLVPDLSPTPHMGEVGLATLLRLCRPYALLP